MVFGGPKNQDGCGGGGEGSGGEGVGEGAGGEYAVADQEQFQSSAMARHRNPGIHSGLRRTLIPGGVAMLDRHPFYSIGAGSRGSRAWHFSRNSSKSRFCHARRSELIKQKGKNWACQIDSLRVPGQLWELT